MFIDYDLIPRPIIRLAEGIYEIHHYGASNWPPGFKRYDDPGLYDAREGETRDDVYKRVAAYEAAEEPYGPWYGVCDDYQDILTKYPALKSCPKRKFVITLKTVIRAEQPSEGGWRFGKWGDYIGKHNIQYAEYIYDEKHIDKVYCFHKYEKVDK